MEENCHKNCKKCTGPEYFNCVEPEAGYFVSHFEGILEKPKNCVDYFETDCKECEAGYRIKKNKIMHRNECEKIIESDD